MLSWRSFQSRQGAFLNAIAAGQSLPVDFDLVELGAGDGTKTLYLLKALEASNEHEVRYLPIDISQNALDKLGDRLSVALPSLSFDTKQGEYFQVLDDLRGERRKVILFLGSNIGNLMDDQARDFIRKLGAVMNQNDLLVIGFDLKKSPNVILPAYNDAAGHTRDFNLNLLTRINNELGGDFDLSKFEHTPVYDEAEGIAKSYLTSKCDQVVSIDALGTSFSFGNGETIHTEISRKYDDQIINQLINGSGLERLAELKDSRTYFTNIIFKRT